jgi:hypothetical protein
MYYFYQVNFGRETAHSFRGGSDALGIGRDKDFFEDGEARLECLYHGFGITRGVRISMYLQLFFFDTGEKLFHRDIIIHQP